MVESISSCTLVASSSLMSCPLLGRLVYTRSPARVYCRRCRPACEISSEPSWLRRWDVSRHPRVAAVAPGRRRAVTELGGSARRRGAGVGPRAGRGGGAPVSRGGEAGRVLRRGRPAACPEPHRPRPLLP